VFGKVDPARPPSVLCLPGYRLRAEGVTTVGWPSVATRALNTHALDGTVVCNQLSSRCTA